MLTPYQRISARKILSGCFFFCCPLLFLARFARCCKRRPPTIWASGNRTAWTVDCHCPAAGVWWSWFFADCTKLDTGEAVLEKIHKSPSRTTTKCRLHPAAWWVLHRDVCFLSFSSNVTLFCRPHCVDQPERGNGVIHNWKRNYAITKLARWWEGVS